MVSFIPAVSYNFMSLLPPPCILITNMPLLSSNATSNNEFEPLKKILECFTSERNFWQVLSKNRIIIETTMHTSTAESSPVFSQSPSANAAGGLWPGSSVAPVYFISFLLTRGECFLSPCVSGPMRRHRPFWLSILQFIFFAFFFSNSHILFLLLCEQEFTIKS